MADVERSVDELVSDIVIAVPSAGRARKQVTLRSLKMAGLLERTYLVVPEKEARSYHNNVQGVFDGVMVQGLPPEWAGIAATREWILTRMTGAKYVVMLDDDMDFCVRLLPGQPALGTIKDGSVLRAMLATLRSWLEQGFVHVGISARQGNNHAFRNAEGVDGLHPWRDVTRMMNAYAYNTAALGKLTQRGVVTLGRVKVMEDFDLTLQLLRAGYPNRVSFDYCWNQRGSGADGGCSTYRTEAVQAAAANELARLHPGFVKVTQKSSPSQQGAMATRTDVNVQWVKAYDSAAMKYHPSNVEQQPWQA